jgi:hypothetical protein
MGKAADITNGFKPAGSKNIHLMTEYATNSPRAIRFQCCCGMKYLYVHGDPSNISIEVRNGTRVEIQGAKGLPMFGHMREDCPGAGAPLTCHGTYIWNGSTWTA